MFYVYNERSIAFSPVFETNDDDLVILYTTLHDLPFDKFRKIRCGINTLYMDFTTYISFLKNLSKIDIYTDGIPIGIPQELHEQYKASIYLARRDFAKYDSNYAQLIHNPENKAGIKIAENRLINWKGLEESYPANREELEDRYLAKQKELQKIYLAKQKELEEKRLAKQKELEEERKREYRERYREYQRRKHLKEIDNMYGELIYISERTIYEAYLDASEDYSNIYNT